MGVPVVLLHGWVDSRRCFDRVMAVLPELVHAFAFDQRGHGDAPRPSDGYALRDCCRVRRPRSIGLVVSWPLTLP
jgi:pimeloyl-ACP methyl ester carboxylesterase